MEQATRGVALIAHIVMIPTDKIEGVLGVLSEFCGPNVKTGEFIDGQMSWPTVEADGEIYGHFHGESLKGIRFVTHITDLALKIEGFLEAQGDQPE